MIPTTPSTTHNNAAAMYLMLAVLMLAVLMLVGLTTGVAISQTSQP